MTAAEFNTLLLSKKLTIATAESITAGLLASTIASVPGASSVLKGGIITYNPELKIKILGVNPKTLEQHSAESIETTIEMVKGLSKLNLIADIYVAVTGVASAPINDYKINKPSRQIQGAIRFYNQAHYFENINSNNPLKKQRNVNRE